MWRRNTQDVAGQTKPHRGLAAMLRVAAVLALLLHAVFWAPSSFDIKEEAAGPRVFAHSETTFSPSCKANDLAIRRFVGEIAGLVSIVFDLAEAQAPHHFAALNYCKSAPSLCCRLCHLAQHALAGGQLG